MRVAWVANISNICTCKYVANRLLSKKQKQRNFKNCFFKIVVLLAFVGNGRSIVPTRTLIFAGACAKPFAKIQQLAPTNNSALVNTFSNTASNVRAIASQSNTTSFRIVVRAMRILHNRVRFFLMAARHLQ